jgi:HAD superfamily hydrolase (TIGR01549 family)
VIWDFDGTLFDTYPVMGVAFQKTLEEAGIIEPLEEILQHMKQSISDTIKFYKAKYHIDDVFVEKYSRLRKEMEDDLCKPYPGITELLRYISTSGGNNYIFTHRGVTTEKILKRHGLYDYFTECITSQHSFERKPSPEAIHYLIGKYDMKPKEAIMIGDRELDILSGKNAGIDACFFDEVGGRSCDVADYTIHTFEELYGILDDMK